MNKLDPDETHWRELASCRDHTDNLFFPVGETGTAVRAIAMAKAVCRDCPVGLDCLNYAVSTGQRFGIWGGMDENERRHLRRRWVASQRSAAEVDLVGWLSRAS